MVRPLCSSVMSVPLWWGREERESANMKPKCLIHVIHASPCKIVNFVTLKTTDHILQVELKTCPDIDHAADHKSASDVHPIMRHLRDPGLPSSSLVSFFIASAFIGFPCIATLLSFGMRRRQEGGTRIWLWRKSSLTNDESLNRKKIREENRRRQMTVRFVNYQHKGQRDKGGRPKVRVRASYKEFSA